MSGILQGAHILTKKGNDYVVTQLFVRNWADPDFGLARNQSLISARAVIGALNTGLRANGQPERFPIVGDRIPVASIELPQFKFALLKSGEEMIQKVSAQKAEAQAVSAMRKVLKAANINF